MKAALEQRPCFMGRRGMSPASRAARCRCWPAPACAPCRSASTAAARRLACRKTRPSSGATRPPTRASSGCSIQARRSDTGLVGMLRAGAPQHNTGGVGMLRADKPQLYQLYLSGMLHPGHACVPGSCACCPAVAALGAQAGRLSMSTDEQAWCTQLGQVIKGARQPRCTGPTRHTVRQPSA